MANTIVTQTPLKIFRGTLKAIEELTPVDGGLYFAYDTGSMYIDIKHQSSETDNFGNVIDTSYTNRYPVENFGIHFYYVSVEDFSEGDSGWEIPLESLEAPQYVEVKVDDILLNRANNHFYKIDFIRESEDLGKYAVCTEIAGGVGAEDDTKPLLTITNISTFEFPKYAILDGDTEAVKSKIKIRSRDKSIGQVQMWATIDAPGGESLKTDPQIISISSSLGINDIDNDPNSTINVTPALFKLGKGQQGTARYKITIHVADRMGDNETSADVYVNLASISFFVDSTKWRATNVYTPNTDFIYPLVINGLVKGSVPGRFKFYIDDELISLTDDTDYIYLDGLDEQGTNFSYNFNVLSYWGDKYYNFTEQKDHVIKVEGFAELDGQLYSIGEYSHNFLWVYDTNNKTPQIISNYTDMVIENYENIVIPFRVLIPGAENNVKVSVIRKVNGVLIPGTLEAPAGNTKEGTSDPVPWTEWTVIPSQYAIGENVFVIQIDGTSVQKTFRATIVENQNYTLTPAAGARVELLTEGRSNSESLNSRTVWANSGESKETENGKLFDFDWYNNGWKQDKEGNPILSLANGANISIPIKADTNYTLDIEMKVKNIFNYSKLCGYTTKYKTYAEDEGDHKKGDIVYEADENNPDIKVPVTEVTLDFNLNDNIIGSFCDITNDTYNGILFGTQDSLFLSNFKLNGGSDNTEEEDEMDSIISNNVGGKYSTVKYNEDEVVKLTFTKSTIETDGRFLGAISIYVNGVLSAYNNIGQISSSELKPSVLTFNSDYCDIDIYKIRYYKEALNFRQVVDNFIADQINTAKDLSTITLSLDNKKAKFDENKLQGSSVNSSDMSTSTIDYEVAMKNSKIPILLIKTYDPSDYEESATPPVGVQYLPFYKGGNHPVKVYYYDPNDLSKNFQAQNADLNVQGTSSQKYPRRNFKLKLKQSTEDLKDSKKESKDDAGNKIPAGSNSFKMAFWSGKTADMDVFKGYYSKDFTETITSSVYESLSDARKADFVERKTFKKYALRTGQEEETSFCLKADYMESSSSHNTGLANFLDQVYNSQDSWKAPLNTRQGIDGYVKASVEIATPEEYEGFKDSKKEKYTLNTETGNYEQVIPATKGELKIAQAGTQRTTIYGFPILLFSQLPGERYPVFEGKYNFNIDKGASASFGFKNGKAVALKDSNGDYLEKDKDGNVVEKYSVADEISYTLMDGSTVKGNTYEQYAECWELKNNQPGLCDFSKPFPGDNAPGTYLKIAKAEIEPRYHISDFDAEDIEEAGITGSAFDTLVSPYYANFAKLANWLYSTNISVATDAPLDQNVYYLTRDTEYNSVKGKGKKYFVKVNDEYKNIKIEPEWRLSSTNDKVSVAIDPMAEVSFYDYLAQHGVEVSLAEAEENSYIFNIYKEKQYDETGKLEAAWLVFSMIRDGENVILTTKKVSNMDGQVENTVDEVIKDYTKWADIGAAIGLKFNGARDTDSGENKETTGLIFELGVVYPTTKMLVNTADDTYEAYSEDFGERVVYEYYTNDTKEYRLAKFKNEIHKHLNLQYCLIYFCITEALILYDSRGKNMMLASWGPEEKDGDYIWYPIFYDMDTQLGLNNSGFTSFDYDCEATTNKLYSTSNSALWINLAECFNREIGATYAALRSGALKSMDAILKYYTTDQSNRWPEIVKNCDAYWKYILPSLTIDSSKNPDGRFNGGFMAQNSTEVSTSVTSSYFYCVQGDRNMDRKQFISQRLNYLDSKWLKGIYATGQAENSLQIRYNINDPQRTSDIGKMEESKAALEGNANFAIKPYLHQYYSLYYDEVPQPETPQAVHLDPKANNTLVIGPNETIQKAIEAGSPIREQLVYFKGSTKYLSEIGDLGLKYLNEFILNDSKITKLKIGCNVDGYRNVGLEDKNFKINSEQPLLHEVDLTNLSALRENLDLLKCPKLWSLKLLGTGLQQANVVDGTLLHTCYYPATFDSIAFTSAKHLKNLLFHNKATKLDPKGLFLEGITNRIGSKLTKKLAIKNFKLYSSELGIESYRIFERIYLDKKDEVDKNIENGVDSKGVPALAIDLTDVVWTPYKQVIKGDSFNDEQTYYELQDDHTYADITARIKSSVYSKLEVVDGEDAPVFGENISYYTKENDVIYNKILDSSILTAMANDFENYIKMNEVYVRNPLAFNKFILNPGIYTKERYIAYQSVQPEETFDSRDTYYTMTCDDENNPVYEEVEVTAVDFANKVAAGLYRMSAYPVQSLGIIDDIISKYTNNTYYQDSEGNFYESNHFIGQESNRNDESKRQWYYFVSSVTATDAAGNTLYRLPILTGEIHVENDAQHPVDEYELTEKYNSEDCFPDLKITAAYTNGCYRATFNQFDLDDYEYNEYAVLNQYIYRTKNAEDVIKFNDKNDRPTWTHRDFVGWTTDREYATVRNKLGEAPTDEKWNNIVLYRDDDDTNDEWIIGARPLSELHFSDITPAYTFYAVFDLHKYKISLYDSELGDPKPTDTYVQDGSHKYVLRQQFYITSGQNLGQTLNKMPEFSGYWAHVYEHNMKNNCLEHETYVFSDWKVVENGNTLSRNEFTTVLSDFTLVPVYEGPVNVKSDKNALKAKHVYINSDGAIAFRCPYTSQAEDGRITLSSSNMDTRYAKDYLPSGKIYIPKTIKVGSKDLPVTGIIGMRNTTNSTVNVGENDFTSNGFIGNPRITHVVFDPDCDIVAIGTVIKENANVETIATTPDGKYDQHATIETYGNNLINFRTVQGSGTANSLPYTFKMPFFNMKELRDVVFPNSTIALGAKTFYECPKLCLGSMEDKDIGDTNNIQYIGAQCFGIDGNPAISGNLILQIGKPDAKIMYLGVGAFWNAPYSKMVVYLNNSNVDLRSGADLPELAKKTGTYYVFGGGDNRLKYIYFPGSSDFYVWRMARVSGSAQSYLKDPYAYVSDNPDMKQYTGFTNFASLSTTVSDFGSTSAIKDGAVSANQTGSGITCLTNNEISWINWR